MNGTRVLERKREWGENERGEKIKKKGMYD